MVLEKRTKAIIEKAVLGGLIASLIFLFTLPLIFTLIFAPADGNSWRRPIDRFLDQHRQDINSCYSYNESIWIVDSIVNLSVNCHPEFISSCNYCLPSCSEYKHNEEGVDNFQMACVSIAVILAYVGGIIYIIMTILRYKTL